MKCLMVCDNLPSSDLIEKLIKMAGGFKSIHKANNIDSATQELIKFAFDLAILDITASPDANINLIKWIRSEKVNVGVIILSSENSVEYVRQAFGYGVCDYVMKPFSYNRFKQATARAIGKREYLNEYKHMNQNEIDHFLALNAYQKDILVPHNKGISLQTLKKVEDVITQEDRPFTAKELASETGLSRITVRRYLEHMVENNVLNTRFHYGEVGRPQKVYQKK